MNFKKLIKLVLPSFAIAQIRKIRHNSRHQTRSIDVSNEIKLLKGKKVSTSKSKSVLFFTTVKCASTYMKDCLSYLNGQYLDLVEINLAYYFWDYTNFDTYNVLKEKESTLFHSQGILYSPLRQYIPINEIDDYRILLMLRDPRDVIVSQYYSRAYSHATPADKNRQKTFLEGREKARNQTIDQFAIDRSQFFLEIYSDYCNYLIKEKNIKWLRYEDFMQNFELWLKQLENILEIEISEPDQRFLYELKGGDKVIPENKLNHIRKGMPGDHKEKLSQETQDFLNTKFSAILKSMGYA